MANCNDTFSVYHYAIKLTSIKKNTLKAARKAVRDKIRTFFKDTLEYEIPKFYGQGSYAMNTLVNPLNGEYDIDDGVYLQNLDDDKDKWVAPETAHGWIVKATDGHTNEKPIDKNNCVRVRYAGNYHVDLPIYGIDAGTSYLAVKGSGWEESNPKLLADWFRSKVRAHGEQLRNVIRYFKAWADYQSQASTAKMPSGIILTILVTEAFNAAENRDDTSFLETAKAIKNRLLISSRIDRPVKPFEDLGEHLSDAQLQHLIDQLKALIEKGTEAANESDKKKACQCWRDALGDRFPECESGDGKMRSDAFKTGAPAILGSDGRSA